jgi:hypothetical protein
MANETNAFADLVPTEDAPVAAVEETIKPEATKFKGLSDTDRAILNNFFDTQPNRRLAYGKKLGIEIDPKDLNKFRPLGSKGEYEGEIDPGLSEYTKPGGWTELYKDLKDVGYDILVQGPVTGYSSAAGAKLAAAGGPWAAIGGAVVGGGIGNAASEGLKGSIGDWLLDQDYVPPDRALTAIQSIIVGMAPAVMKAGGTLTKEAAQGFWNVRTEAIKNAIRATGGMPDEGLIDYAAKNPKMFTKEAVKGANEALQGTYKSIFGLEPDELLTKVSKREAKYIPENSLFRPKMDQLSKAQSAELMALDKNKAANWTVEEISGPLKATLARIETKLPSERTAEEEAARGYLLKKLDQLYRDAAEVSGKSIDDYAETVKVPKFTKTGGEVSSTQRAVVREQIAPTESKIVGQSPYQGKATMTETSFLEKAGINPSTLAVDEGQLNKVSTDLITGKRTLEPMSDSEVKSLIEKTGLNREQLLSAVEKRSSVSASTPIIQAGEPSKFGKDIGYDVKTHTPEGYKISGYDTYKIVKRADKSGLDQVQVPYSRGRGILDSMQSDAFDIEVPGSRFLKQSITTSSDRGLGFVADQKATAAGSTLQDINGKISSLLNTYKTNAQALTPDNLRRAFTSTNPDAAVYANVKSALAMADQELGTQLSTDVGLKSLQAWAENIHRNPKAFGSGRVMPEMAKGAVKGAASGAGLGAATGYAVGSTGPGAAIGGGLGLLAGGYRAGVMASPETALNVLGKTQGISEAIGRMPVPNAAALDAATQAAPATLREAISQYSPSALQGVYTSPLRELARPVVPVKPVEPPVEQNDFADLVPGE